MRKTTMMALFFLMAGISRGQDGHTHFTLRGGYLYDNAATFSLGLDFAKKYHSAWELTGTYIRSFSNGISYETIFNPADSTYAQRTLKHAYKNLLMGVQYKPAVVRDKNTLFRFRFGGYLGSDFDHFVMAPNIGMELLKAFSPSVSLFFSSSNGYYLWATPKDVRWRHTAEAGIRIAI